MTKLLFLEMNILFIGNKLDYMIKFFVHIRIVKSVCDLEENMNFQHTVTDCRYGTTLCFIF